jgi:hypothetical protein
LYLFTLIYIIGKSLNDNKSDAHDNGMQNVHGTPTQDATILQYLREHGIRFIDWPAFSNVTYIASGGFGKIFSANVADPRILSEIAFFTRSTDSACVLKSIGTTYSETLHFLDEVSITAHKFVFVFHISI